jgi:hypothetical protein
VTRVHFQYDEAYELPDGSWMPAGWRACIYYGPGLVAATPLPPRSRDEVLRLILRVAECHVFDPDPWEEERGRGDDDARSDQGLPRS